MSFWKGLARGFADADAKKEREQVRAEAEAARQEALSYGRSRDEAMDARYEAEQQTAAAQAEEAKRRWELTFNQSAASLKADREWRKSQAEQAQENLDRAFEREGEYSERAWALNLDKWDFTKDQADVAQEQADRIFNQGVAQFEYSQSRDVVGDLRADRAEARAIANELYSKERDLVGDAQAAQNRQDRLDQFQFQVTRAGVSDEQWQDSFDLQKEQVEIQRTTQLLAAMPSGLSTALSGGTGSTSGKDSVMEPAAMKAGAEAFGLVYKDLPEDARNSEFFKAAASSPAAQATIMGFLEAQAKKGNTIELTDVPKYFRYLGAAEGKGEAEAKEFMSSLMSGDANLGDKDTFINGLMAMRNYRPTKQLFMQTGAPASVDDAAKQIPLWENAVEVDAYLAMANLEGDDKLEVQRALAMLERKENRTQGLDILAKYGYGMNAVKEYNMHDNSIIKGYYGDTSAPAAAPVAATVPPKDVAAAAPVATITPPPQGDVKAFNTWEEVSAARAEGFSGPASVGGVTYNVEPLATPAGDVVEPVVATDDLEAAVAAEVANTPVEGEFLGTGPLEEPTIPEGTAIDAMFAEAAPDQAPVVAASEAQWPDNRPVIDELPDVDIEAGVERLEADTTVDDAMAELMEMGIEMPTNREELGFFKEDLKSLVYEYGANIPEDMLKKIIGMATANSTKGEVMQDQTNPPATADEQWNRSPKQGKPLVKRRKPKAKKMTSSDKARLKRAMAADDAGLISMLYDKYGQELVTKEMGL